ncbi:FMN-binding negative transcriptional regulator [Burkholderia sp. Ap-962]|uniref:FMN-binding negative transcriptional regulator n=1 Tax=Burkholderia sp. Ap-962 TaxID=2608333 RepID=UPI0014201248|nr:FMN-binding negative transcriptional regulator [Burkholderia sp. Ap-962]NIF72149.1 FMN-binding negative transcriptional regulator [Burkholderia sp. Ap-962]
MYLPPLFEERNLDTIHATIREVGLATLVTVEADGIDANHVPLFLAPGPTGHGTLRGHVSRNNAQWRRHTGSSQALAVFLGPHSYISPSWYPSAATTGRVVPTWNYLAVHAYGRLEFYEDRERVLDVITRMTELQEAGRAQPWSVEQAPPDHVDTMLKHIVGFDLHVERIECKRKMSQYASLQDHAGAMAGLREAGSAAGRAVAGIMAEQPPQGEPVVLS